MDGNGETTSFFHGKDLGVSLNGGTPISHPKMIILVGKAMGLLGKPTILGNTRLKPHPVFVDVCLGYRGW